MFKFKELFIAMQSESCDPDDPDAATFIKPNNPTTLCCDTVTINWSMGVPGTPWPMPAFVAAPPVGYGGYYLFPVMPFPLKQYLQTALEQAAKPAEATRKAMKPQTVAEVEMLEEKLRAALEELRDRKAELRKAEKK